MINRVNNNNEVKDRITVEAPSNSHDTEKFEEILNKKKSETDEEYTKDENKENLIYEILPNIQKLEENTNTNKEENTIEENSTQLGVKTDSVLYIKEQAENCNTQRSFNCVIDDISNQLNQYITTTRLSVSNDNEWQFRFHDQYADTNIDLTVKKASAGNLYITCNTDMSNLKALFNELNNRLGKKGWNITKSSSIDSAKYLLSPINN
jgi:hypothetical protein